MTYFIKKLVSRVGNGFGTLDLTLCNGDRDSAMSQVQYTRPSKYSIHLVNIAIRVEKTVKYITSPTFQP